MTQELIKCAHCDFIDYLDKDPGRCPKCGSTCSRVESEFEDQSIMIKVQNTDGQWTKMQVTFLNMEKQFNSIMGKCLKDIIKDEFKRSNILFMMKIYIWLMLKKQPELWLSIDMVISGLKEIFTLRIKSED